MQDFDIHSAGVKEDVWRGRVKGQLGHPGSQGAAG